MALPFGPPVLPTPQQLKDRISRLISNDSRRLAGKLDSLRRRVPADVDRAVGDLVREIEGAEGRLRARRASVPRTSYPPDLPISQRREDIARAIDQNQIVVVCGETGSGKTTQLPKICLDLGRGVRGLIGHTQPRRIAATSVSARIADELGVAMGRQVGFKIRFGDKTSGETLIKLMTDGILLAETQNDRWLEAYDTLIIDEAHERSLNIDFLMGYLRTILPKRPDLKVIVTSATIDPDRFANHFTIQGRRPPVVMVSGRAFPVEVVYRPLPEETLEDRDWSLHDHVKAAISEAAHTVDGDILVFLPGEREIREVADDLSAQAPTPNERWAILPLFSRLSSADQMRVFQPFGGRRVVLSTNVAETSVTVPGIRAVVDAGVARIKRYSPRTKVTRLEIESISRASADQRKGRSGRIAPGICYRLYSEDDYRARPEFTDPEIVRSNLAAVILQMKALNLGAVEAFPFVEAPDSRMIKDGYETLLELGAVDERNELTPNGKRLAKLPIDPRIGRMILAAQEENCLSEGLIIAAALSVQDPRERPMDEQDKADMAHRTFRHESSDFLSLLKLWDYFQEAKKALSGSRLRRLCKDSYVSFMRMREWDEVHAQLLGLVKEMEMRPSGKSVLTERDGPDRVQRAVLAGLLGNIGIKGEAGEYTGPRNIKFHIFPGSALHKNGPKWVVATEIVRTSRVYARTVGAIKPEWVEGLAGALLKRSHTNPRWAEETGTVIADERGTIYGLELYARRRVNFGEIDVKAASEIFIQHALVMGEWETRGPFIEHNARVIDEVRRLEAKTRRTDLLLDQQARYDFFARRVPAEINTGVAFERWRAEKEKTEPRVLMMGVDDLLVAGAGVPAAEAFPDVLTIGDAKLPLRYALNPGKDDDGVTVRLPLEALARLDGTRFDWTVPGWLDEKLQTILKGLSKDFRRALPHSSLLASKLLPDLKFGEGDLFERLMRLIRLETGADVPEAELRAVMLPTHLRMRFEVVGEDGGVLAVGRDLGPIREKLAPKLRERFLTISDPAFTKDKIKVWDFGVLASSVQIRRFGMAVEAYPAIVDMKESVSIKLFDSPAAADEGLRPGLRRLAILTAGEEFRKATAFLPAADRLALSYAVLGKASELKPLMREVIADRAFLADDAGLLKAEVLPRDAKAFEKFVDRGLSRLGRAIDEVATLFEQILTGWHAVHALLGKPSPAGWAPVIVDVREQMALLCPPGFMATTPYENMRHYPRYFAAIQLRLMRLGGDGIGKDLRKLAELQPWWRSYATLAVQDPVRSDRDPAVRQMRWMIEEYRVSLFAQELRTAFPVSVKRLGEQWNGRVVGATK